MVNKRAKLPSTKHINKIKLTAEQLAAHVSLVVEAFDDRTDRGEKSEYGVLVVRGQEGDGGLCCIYVSQWPSYQ